MPAADDLIPDLDDSDAKPAPPSEPSATYTWPTKKSKKKSKKKNAAAKVTEGWDEEEDASRPQPTTPPVADTPPAEPDPGASLPPVSPQRVPERENAKMSPPPIDWEDDMETNEPPAPPPMRSPRTQAPKLASPPVSPPTRHATLYNGTPQYGVAADRRNSTNLVPNSQPRRESLSAQASPRPQFASPPPPHMPQPHFFGLPDIGLNFGQKQEQGKPAGADGCCRFDSFSDAGHLPSVKKARDAFLVSGEGGIDVYRVLPDKMEVIGRLEGLRGAVVGAKILPHLDRRDNKLLRPCIAVVVHGLTADDRNDSGQDDENQDLPSYYQTTVEVYSLQSHVHVATLFKSIPVAIEPPTMGHVSLPPKPIGDLELDAAGNFVTLASGKSGEVFIFSRTVSSDVHNDKPQFRCVGKVWTSLQTFADPKRPQGTEAAPNVPLPEKRPGVPLLSLSGRWLAIVPPFTSAGISVQGSALSDKRSPAEVATHMAPVQPAITCEVAGVDAEGTLSWLSRKAAQGLLNASQKGYELGIQGWKELTQPPSSTYPRENGAGKDQDVFPPTNGPADDPKRLTREPALISLIDMHKLIPGAESKPQPPPLATFPLIDGCNHLSFSPDGLRLLTVSRKGETSIVWDLKNVVHGNAKMNSLDDEETEHGPHVKPIHKIARSSPATALRTVWSKDGDWLAMLTANGTIHLHEIPLRRPYKKRKRRTTFTASDKTEATIGISGEGMSPPSSNGIWGTLKSSLQNVTTQVGAISSPGVTSNFAYPTFAGFREATTAARTAGGRAVARGISQGYSAAKGGASDIWHAEDNKIRHKILQEAAPRTTSLRWIERQGSTALAIICGGAVHLHPVQHITRRKGDVNVTGLKHEKHARKTFALPRVTINNGPTKTPNCADEGPHGFWSLRYTGPISNQPSTLTQPTDEVETNPPYCPFHIDARVNIHAFTDSLDASRTDSWANRGHGLKKEGPWLFGEALPTSVKMNDGSLSEVDDFDRDAMLGGDGLDGMTGMMESRLTFHQSPTADGKGSEEQIYVNTTRRAAGMEVDFLDELVTGEDDGDDLM